jgi:replication initiation protein RepC
MLGTERLGETFNGLPDKTLPGRVLAAFKAAAPALGYSARLIHAVDWLFSFTQPQDWAEGSRPIVWPSARLQEEALGLGTTQVKAINRQLAELWLVTMKDSPNGKRYGRRDAQGRIIEAYGFDLAPLASRLEEFQAVAAKARDEREAMRRLRRRATIALRGLEQVLETAAELSLASPVWGKLGQEARALARSLKNVERSEELALGVAALERRHAEAKKHLEDETLADASQASEGVDSDPKGSENRPHQYNYKPNLNPQEDTVMASEECKSRLDPLSPTTWPVPRATERRGVDQSAVRKPRMDAGPVMRLTTDELVRMAPRLKPYLRTPSPTWPDIVDAADWLRHDLGVSQPLWGEACLAMGREQAAIALAIVSMKPAEHFTSSPGGYFHGMVARARAGTLNLSRTIWGFKGSQDSSRRPRGH